MDEHKKEDSSQRDTNAHIRNSNEQTLAQSVAAKIISTVRLSELVYQDAERDRRLKIRKVLNQAIDRKQ